MFRIESGVIPAIWVVNAPIHRLDEPDPSRATPLTEKENTVPDELGAKINGDPALGEQAGRFGSSTAAQTVLFTPGPSDVRSKWRFGLPVNVMKSSTVPPPAVRSFATPATPDVNGPPPV